MSGNARSPARNRSTRDVVGGDERSGGARSGTPGRARHGEGREARLVGRLEGHESLLTHVQARRRARPAPGMVEGVLDGDAHVGEPELGLLRAVHELDERVDEALGVDDDVDVLVGDIVEPVRLDDLQALVHERGRVDGDLGAHRPGGVGQGVRRGRGGHGLRRPVAERPAGGGQDEPRDAAQVLADEALPDGRVLRVDGPQPGQRRGQRRRRRRRHGWPRPAPVPAA